MISLVGVVALVALAASVPLLKWQKSEDGSVYYIESEQKYNWFDSWNECARRNMSLVAIDTLYKHEQIDTLMKKLFKAEPSFWLGANDLAIDTRYAWSSTGESFTFSNWFHSEPNRHKNEEHCLCFYTGLSWQWGDHNCAVKIGFICEENRFLKQKSPELVTTPQNCEQHGNKSTKYNNVIFHINRY